MKYLAFIAYSFVFLMIVLGIGNFLKTTIVDTTSTTVNQISHSDGLISGNSKLESLLAGK